MKIVFCLTRLPDLSPEEFRDHWFNVHAPLVKKHQVILQIARYIQLHTLADPMSEKLRAFRGSPEPFDGVAEIWYESASALESIRQNPEARAASAELRDDEARFVDISRSPIWIADERVII